MVFLCVFIFEWVDLVKIYPEDKNFQIVIEVSFNINGSSKGITFSVYLFTQDAARFSEKSVL